MHTCPVCGYSKLEFPPEDFTICPSCGTEFGYQDTCRSHKDLRDRWIANGPKWHSLVIKPPYLWNPYQQLIDAKYGLDIPFVNGLIIKQETTYLVVNDTTEMTIADGSLFRNGIATSRSVQFCY